MEEEDEETEEKTTTITPPTTYASAEAIDPEVEAVIDRINNNELRDEIKILFEERIQELSKDIQKQSDEIDNLSESNQELRNTVRFWRIVSLVLSFVFFIAGLAIPIYFL